jgi:GT2 family glycosyltransferase
MIERESTKLQLSVIILNYKTDELILNLVSSLTPHTKMEIIIVDNSPKNSLESKLPKRNDLSYFFTGENLGFSGGNNFGISSAKGEWMLLLNSDTKTNTQYLLKLLEITIINRHLVSCPKLIQLDGKIQNNVGYFDSFQKNLLNKIFARPRFIDCSKITSNTTVDLLTGAAMLVHKSVFKKIGLLDDNNFFIYFEDIDFSYRLNRVGTKVLYVPEVTVTHYGGASSDQDSRQKNKNYQQGLQTYIIKHRGFIINFVNNIFHLFS